LLVHVCACLSNIYVLTLRLDTLSYWHPTCFSCDIIFLLIYHVRVHLTVKIYTLHTYLFMFICMYVYDFVFVHWVINVCISSFQFIKFYLFSVQSTGENVQNGDHSEAHLSTFSQSSKEVSSHNESGIEMERSTSFANTLSCSSTIFTCLSFLSIQ